MIATSFASDTPLWVGALVRQYGIHAAWQYWTPLIGCALGVALFSRVWRRTRVVTDNEMLELRYSGKGAQTLRGITAAVGALLICPMIIGWVCKAMITIAQEALGVSGQTFMLMGAEVPAKIVVTIVVRVWMPDRPGALGQIATRIGAVRGDVLAIEILEQGAGRAIDELTVLLPDDLPPRLLHPEGAPGRDAQRPPRPLPS